MIGQIWHVNPIQIKLSSNWIKKKEAITGINNNEMQMTVFTI